MRSNHLWKALSFTLAAAAVTSVGCGGSDDGDCAATSTCSVSVDAGVDVSSDGARADGATDALTSDRAAVSDVSIKSDGTDGNERNDVMIATTADGSPDEGSEATTDATDSGLPLQCDGSSPCQDHCVDYSTDNAHCGSCENACAGLQECSKGKCCPQGQTNCGGDCYNLNANNSNCGTCGKPCMIGETCSDGLCCPPTQKRCGNECVDPMTNVSNCGGCNQACVGQICAQGICCSAEKSNCGGACVDLKNDKMHCGDCNTKCDGVLANGSYTCVERMCQKQCDDLQQVCNGSVCCGKAPPNMNVSCPGQCIFSCKGTTLACTLSGHDSCGIWSFESGTAEGWTVDDTNKSAWTNTFGPSTVQHDGGTSSLAVGFDSTLGNGLAVRVPLCSVGSVTLQGTQRLKARVFLDGSMVSPPGTPGPRFNLYPSYWDASLTIHEVTTVVYSTGAWFQVDVPLFFDGEAQDVSYIGFEADANWKGTIFFDNVSIE